MSLSSMRSATKMRDFLCPNVTGQPTPQNEITLILVAGESCPFLFGVIDMGKCLHCKTKLVREKRNKYCSYGCYWKSQRTSVLKSCKACSKIFFVFQSTLIRGEGIYCSKRCFYEHTKKPIKYETDKNGCHICTSHLQNHSKYPYISIKNKPVKMVRYIYEQKHGKISKGLVTRHTCDNTKCINIDHILIGTPQDNINDMVERNRQARGETHGMSKLTESQVRKIRNNKTFNGAELGRMYGVHRCTIYSIQKHEKWTHI